MSKATSRAHCVGNISPALMLQDKTVKNNPPCTKIAIKYEIRAISWADFCKDMQ